MSALDRQQDVIQKAADLGLDWRQRPTFAIIAYCQCRIAGWLERNPGVRSLDKLEALICGKLGLVFEEFRSDEELDEIIARYVAKGEIVFESQRAAFGPDTFATLIRRDNASPECADRFVAIIDCRGEKASRRFFTRWHEIAHVLTLVDGQMALPFHRSTVKRDPVEQLMDKIAAEIGFYDPIFRPAVEVAVEKAGALGLSLVDQIQESMCPTASFQATLIAVVNRVSTPAVSLEAGPGLKRSEWELVNNPGLFPELRPVPELRVLTVGGNEAARRARLRIHRNMRVPETSMISQIFNDPAINGDVRASESLSTWVTSGGGAIDNRTAIVEARRRGDSIIALISLVK